MFLLFAILASYCSNAQWVGLTYTNIEPANYLASYSLKSQRDSTNSEQIQNSKLLLFIGDYVSKFINRANFILDTATRSFTSADQTIAYLQNPQNPKPAQIYQIYKNYSPNKITYLDHIPSDAYKFEEDLDLFDWQITSDTTTVCGFKSQMATCEFGGRKWIAWFAPEIPFSDGPYKFNGLPGLIVKVYDTRHHYVFELTAFNKLEPPLIIDMEDKSYILTTKQGFFKAQDSFREDIMNRAKAVGFDDEAQKSLLKNMSSRNNPIELIRK